MESETLIGRCLNGLELLAAKLTGVSSWINSDYAPNSYLNEVRRDIALLEEGLEDAKFERDRNDIFQFIAKKYREKYCPCTFYKLFSFENQLDYLYLRTEIDELLSQTNP